MRLAKLNLSRLTMHLPEKWANFVPGEKMQYFN